MKKIRVGTRIIGELSGDTLIKRGRQAALFRIYDGFGVPEELTHNPEIARVEIHYQDKVYSAPMASFADTGLGIPCRRPGYELQIVLPRRHFAVTDTQQTTMFLDGIYAKGKG